MEDQSGGAGPPPTPGVFDCINIQIIALPVSLCSSGRFSSARPNKPASDTPTVAIVAAGWCILHLLLPPAAVNHTHTHTHPQRRLNDAFPIQLNSKHLYFVPLIL